NPSDHTVQPVQLTCGGECLLCRAENHGEDDAEGIVEADDGIVQSTGVLGDGSCNPRVSQLQQRGATRGQKERRFTVDLPANGVGTEKSFPGLGDRILQTGQQLFQIARRYGPQGHTSSYL